METPPVSGLGSEQQNPSPQIQVVQTFPASASVQKSNKSKLIIAITIIILILGAGSAYAYTYFMTPPAPSFVLGKMIGTLSGIQNGEVATIMAIQVHHELIENASTSSELNASPIAGMAPLLTQFLGSSTSVLSGTVTSTFDISDKSNPKSDSQLLFTYGGAGQNIAITLGGEIRGIGPVIYGQATNIPNLGFFDPTQIEGKWASVDTSALPSSTIVSAEPTSTIAANAIKKAFTDPAFLSAHESDIVKVFSVTKVLPDETINAFSTYHYAMTIDVSALNNLLAIVASYESASPTSTAAIESITDGLQPPTGELWIDKQDFYPRQISFTFNFNQSIPSYSVNGSVAATSTFESINGGVNIEAPTVTWDLNSIISSMNSANIPSQVNRYDAFAKCIAQSGAKFYGAFWAPHSTSQKSEFGSSGQYLPYVECSLPDESGQTQVCIDNNIQTYPTWTFQSGSRLTGVVSPATLSTKTGCALPQ